MREYLSEAVVLEKRPIGEADFQVSFYTKKYGKMVARARSARKITSKLSSHLEPGNVVQLRIVEKRGFHVADALKKKKLEASLIDLSVLSGLLAADQHDAQLWDCLVASPSWGAILGILGWDAQFADCRMCRKKPELFHLRSHDFFCTSCGVLETNVHELLYL